MNYKLNTFSCSNATHGSTSEVINENICKFDCENISQHVKIFQHVKGRDLLA